MRLWMVVPTALLCLFFTALKIMAWQSQRQSVSYLDVMGETLPACPDKPNCQCSCAPEGSSHYFPSLNVKNKSDIHEKILKTIESLKGHLVETKGNFYHFELKSPLLGFVDDVLIEFNQDKEELLFRSSSRVGYSDLGANKKNLKKFVDIFQTL